MCSVIESLWSRESLPIKSGIYYANDVSIEIDVLHYPKKNIVKGSYFILSKFMEENPDHTTTIDGLYRFYIKDVGIFICGEGAHGSEGFFTHLKPNGGLVWVAYFEESNPFIKIDYEGKNDIILTSSAGYKLKVPITRPEDLCFLNC